MSAADMSTATVDVALCVFNAEDTVKECILSVLDQTALGVLFVLDDASTDATGSVLTEFETNPQIKIISQQQNAGLAAGLNVILGHSKAEYIARIDADDKMLPGRLVAQRDYLIRNPEIDVLGSNALLESKDKSTRATSVPLDHQAIARELKFRNPMIHPSVMFRREALLVLGGYDQTAPRGQDVLLWEKSVAAGLKFANLKDAYIVRRTDNDRTTKSYWQELKTNIRRAAKTGNPRLFFYSGAIFFYQVLVKRLRK